MKKKILVVGDPVKSEMLAVLRTINSKIHEGGYRATQYCGELGVYLKREEIDALREAIRKAELP